MRIAENLEVRISSTGKTFQIVSTSGRKDFVVASIPRDIGDQLFNKDGVWGLIAETYNEVRDQLPTRETLRNTYEASKHEAKTYRATPANMEAVVSKDKAKTFNPIEVPAIKAMQAKATEQRLLEDKKARLKELLAIARGKAVKSA